MNWLRLSPTLLLALILLSSSGCAVPQPKGNGRVSREVEPKMQAGYWLYLPEDYVDQDGQKPGGERWPLVVTFHGMKPYDNANPQIREWQQEADRYGFIVIAPELKTCDSFMQYPLRDATLSYVQRDEKAIMAIMDDVFRRTNADPERVLATSWSSGGYIAHYIVNRHPARFSCLAVRQSNFSSALLDPRKVPQYRNYKIGIFFGENDFKQCREESKEAVVWYKKHRFPHVEAKYVGGLGHERTPQTAAAFFASDVGASPKSPPNLSGLVMYDIDEQDLGKIRPRPAPQPAPRARVTSDSPSPRPPQRPQADSTRTIYNRSPNVVFNPPSSKAPAVRNVESASPSYRVPSTLRTPSRSQATPRRPVPQPYSIQESPAPRSGLRRSPSAAVQRESARYPDLPARIVLHGDDVGTAPMMVHVSIEMPENLAEGASVLWMDDREPIGKNGLSATRMLREPGEHEISAIVVTADDRKTILRKRIRVLDSAASQPAG